MTPSDQLRHEIITDYLRRYTFTNPAFAPINAALIIQGAACSEGIACRCVVNQAERGEACRLLVERYLPEIASANPANP